MIGICDTSAGVISNLANDWKSSWIQLLEGNFKFERVCELLPDVALTELVGVCKLSAEQDLRSPTRARELALFVASQVYSVVEDFRQKNPDASMSLILATGHGESGAISTFARAAHSNTLESISDSVCNILLQEDIAIDLAKALRIEPPTYTISAACASAAVGTAHGIDLLRNGFYDAAVVVAVDPLSIIGCAGFKQIGATSLKSCIPFSKQRDGITISESASAYVLTRFQPHYCENEVVPVLGTGVSCAARHVVEPDQESITFTARTAMKKAQVDPSEIRAVYFHGTGTVQNDMAEALAYRSIFGSGSPPATSVKGNFGHSMGASAGLTILAACNSVRTGLLPAIPNLSETDCPWVDLVMHHARKIEPGPILVLTQGFGGISAATVLGYRS